MGYAVYWEDEHNRFAGYGVPSVCEHPDCKKKIHRGLGCVCGGEPGGGDDGCGLYFCGHHLSVSQRCERCAKKKKKKKKKPFAAKPDTLTWVRHMIRDPTWEDWRRENQTEVEAMENRLKKRATA
jgi:hypothetical protein